MLRNSLEHAASVIGQSKATSQEIPLRSFFLHLGKELKYTDEEDWYQLRRSFVLSKPEGKEILQRFDGSHVNALFYAFPELKSSLVPWKFAKLPAGYWQDESNQRGFFLWLAEKLGYRNPVELYQANISDVFTHGGGPLLAHYNSSLIRALQALFPECKPSDNFENFLELQSYVKRKSKSFWDDLTTQRKYFEWLGHRLGVKKNEDWYSLPSLRAKILANGGRTLLTMYGDSPARALAAAFPDFDWLRWMFEPMDTDFFHELKNQRKYLEWLGKLYCFTRPEHWYDVRQSHFLENRGGKLLEHYHESPGTVVANVFPEHRWLQWKFAAVAEHFWEDHANQRSYFHLLSEVLNYQEFDDWYSIRASDITSNGGSTLLKLCDGSPSAALRAVFPEHQWELWRFSALPVNFSQNEANVKHFLDKFEENLQIKSPSDWYRVSGQQLQDFGGASVIEKVGGLQAMLAKRYPNYQWDESKFFGRGKKAAQRWLLLTVKDLLGSREVFENFRHPSLVFSRSKEPLELDIWVPSLALAFEYQGQHHYNDIFYFGAQKNFNERDTEKKELCENSGITLVEIPYWWDRRRESLLATIAKCNQKLSTKIFGSDLSLEAPIPNEPPAKRAPPNDFTKSSFMLAEDYDNMTEPTGWWLSEKLEGVRAQWNPKTKQFVSKQGKEIPMPESFKRSMNLPDISLDGDLWYGRGSLQRLYSIIKSPNEDDWANLIYRVSDTPDAKHRTRPFEERLDILKNVLSARPSNNVELTKVELCEGREHLNKMLSDVLEAGGKGLILRKFGSFYEPGKSGNMLSVMPNQDADVKFLGLHNSFGLLCEQTNKMKCIVQCSGQTYASPPEEGETITVSHGGLWASGKLRYPFFLRVKR
eukprot:TRINITY_DN7884_c0_g1_i1.p1 TRINITY_DN7884_c0_g1~~TRINITY_DN7884_c0_g1_i1.p1  ORF type:complete len:873 (-),score=176.06 TRINITY_DN7884_c0_g1_i1:3235-5853(-)